MANLLGRNESQTSLEDILMSEDIVYASENYVGVSGFLTRNAKIYRYEKSGQKRVAYEVSEVLPPDDYIIISVIFDGEASPYEVANALRGRQ